MYVYRETFMVATALVLHHLKYLKDREFMKINIRISLRKENHESGRKEHYYKSLG